MKQKFDGSTITLSKALVGSDRHACDQSTVMSSLWPEVTAQGLVFWAQYQYMYQSDMSA